MNQFRAGISLVGRIELQPNGVTRIEHPYFEEPVRSIGIGVQCANDKKAEFLGHGDRLCAAG